MSLRNNRLRENHNGVDAGPLNDILFILLMFFLMISTLANPNVIKVSVPRSKSNTKSKQTVIVSIDKQINYYVGAKRTPMDSLESSLKKYINEGDSIKPGIVINSDSSVELRHIVEVFKVATRLGATASIGVTGSE